MDNRKMFFPVLTALVVLSSLSFMTGRSAASQIIPNTPAGTYSVYLPVVLKQVFPNASNYQWMEVASGLSQPVDIKHAGDNSGRLFIVEQSGRIRILSGGQILSTPFLDITDRVVGSSEGEQGLLGLAFHPNYAANGLFYVNYTDLNGDTVIARFSISGNPNQANANSETRLLAVDQPFTNHNGGALAFGPDGYLYISLGDGGSAGDPYGNAQSLNTLLGKILRIDVNTGSPYGIPPTNPFANGGGLPEIWVYGLRNPWRFAFDTMTGGLYIGDVGQGAWEEINFLPAGTNNGPNLGWDYYEGTHPYEGTPPSGMQFTMPVAEYGHDLGCSVTGGEVYRGTMAEWQGIYVYGDFCSGRIWGLLYTAGQWQSALLFDTNFGISTFGRDQAGEVYVTDYYRGKIYRLERK